LSPRVESRIAALFFSGQFSEMAGMEIKNKKKSKNAKERLLKNKLNKNNDKIKEKKK